MRIRINFFVTLDGKVSGQDGRPVQLMLPGFTGADSYGLPEFLVNCEAVVMGRTTFLPALTAPHRTAVAVEATGLRPDLELAARGHARRRHVSVDRGRTGQADELCRHRR